MGSEAAAMPERVGRYEIVLPIAKGGMATVYLARASGVGGFDRYMALKLTAAHLREDPAFAAHLIEEAKLVSNLRHTNIVPVYDVGECEHGVFLVMEYVPGDSYSGIRRLASQAGEELPKRVALRILVDALNGLHTAHEQSDEDGNAQNLVHRDFSPQNILVGTDGISRLTDFGIAKAASRISTTGAGLIKGKLRYVAPEQARGEELDRRTDIWAAGVIAWELVTGQKLVHVDQNESVVIPKTDPPRARSIDPAIATEMDDAIAGALRVDRTQRTKTAQAFARALTAAANKAGMLADADEVADHVARLAGPLLSERRTLLAEARRRRRDSTPDVRAMVDDRQSTPMRRQLPSLPEMPVTPLSVPGAAASELGIEVDLDGNSPADRASEGILGPAARSLSPEEEAEPSVYRSPVVAQTPLRRVLDATSDLLRPPFTAKKKIALGAGGGAALLGIVVVVASLAGGTKPADKSAGTALGATPSPAGGSPAVGTPAAAAPASPDIEDVPMLHVTANAPISKVAVGDRVIDAVVPAPTVGVELEEADDGKTLKVTVTSADGRTAIATAEPGTRELDVTFGDKPAVRAPAPKDRDKRAPKRPAK
jgi:eukaryotic-like serine/threonine-protein kinase